MTEVPPEAASTSGAPDDQADRARRRRESVFPSVSLSYDEPIELRRGEAQFVVDGAGRQYLDFFGGIATDELALSIRSLSRSTFGGNPIATTAALANLNSIATLNLRENARRVGAYLLATLHDLAGRHPVIVDVRGMGLMVALALVHDWRLKTPAPDLTTRLLDAAKTRGLIIGQGGLHANVIRLCPPLVVSEAAIAILDQSFADIAA